MKKYLPYLLVECLILICILYQMYVPLGGAFVALLIGFPSCYFLMNLIVGAVQGWQWRFSLYSILIWLVITFIIIIKDYVAFGNWISGIEFYFLPYTAICFMGMGAGLVLNKILKALKIV